MIVNAHDVAAHILGKIGPISAMKLQKLVYYSQAWSLVWDEKPLFRDRIEAWASGPVVPNLYRKHRGKFEVANWPSGDPSRLSGVQRDTIEAVVKFYGPKAAFWLSELTHRETPWQEARRGLAPGERGTVEITHAAMAEYYSSL